MVLRAHPRLPRMCDGAAILWLCAVIAACLVLLPLWLCPVIAAYMLSCVTVHATPEKLAQRLVMTGLSVGQSPFSLHMFF